MVGLLLAGVFAASVYLGRDLLGYFKREFRTSFDSNAPKNKPLLVRFAVLSDTHSDTEETKKALAQAKSLRVEYIVDTGDWTTVGTVAELTKQKQLFDAVGLPYWGVLGDHDRWQSGIKNYAQVFGSVYQSFDRHGIHHILFDASDTRNGLYPEELSWLEKDLADNAGKPLLIFMHLPIYHPTSDRTITNKSGTSAEKDAGTARFLELIKGKNVIGMFAGDQHLSSSYTEPTTSAKIFISGAVTRDRNLQTPRFSLVEIYKDWTISVTDQVIN